MSLGSEVNATCSAEVANHVTRHCGDRGGKSLSNGLAATSLALNSVVVRSVGNWCTATFGVRKVDGSSEALCKRSG